MATTIGRVEYTAGIDGSRLPVEARKIGKQLGAELGKNASREFDSAFSDLGANLARKMKGNGDLAGISFGDALQNSIRSSLSGLNSDIADALTNKGGIQRFIDEFDSADEGIDNLRAGLTKLRDAQIATNNEWLTGQHEINGFVDELNAAKDADEEKMWVDARKALDEHNASMRESQMDTLRMRNAINDLRKERDLDLESERQSIETDRERATQLNYQHTQASKLSDAFRNLRRDVKSIGDGDADFQKIDKDIKETTKSSDGLNNSFHKLPHGARQFLFYVALFASLASEIAVLGAAAGAGITIVAGAALSAGIGLGVAVAAFAGLNKELTDLPEAVRPAAAAFQELGPLLSSLQDDIQVHALSGATDAFKSLGETIKGLSPAILTVADSVGVAVNAIAASLAPGTVGFENWNKIIEASGPIFVQIINAAISLGTALGGIFVAALPFVQQFSGWLETLFADFSAWANSLAGQNALAEWFSNAEQVFAAIGPLLAATADALNQLVTPDTVSQLTNLLGQLTQFMPVLGQILGVIAQLNIFGIIATTLNTLGQAIAPILPALGQVASVISGAVMGALAALAPALAGIFTSLAPIIVTLGNLFATLLATAVPVLVRLVDAFLPVVDVIGQLVAQVLPPLLSIIVPIMAAVTELATTLISALMPAFTALIPVVVTILNALMPLVPVIVQIIQQLAGALVPVINALLPVFSALIEAIAPIIAAILPPLISLISALMPVVMQLVNAFVELIAPIMQLLEPLLALIQTILPPLMDLIGFLADIIVGLLGHAFSILIPLIQAVVNIIADVLTPIINGIVAVMQGVIEFIVGVFTGDWEKAWGGIVDIFEGLFNSLTGIAEGVINGIIDLINGIIGGINAIGDAFGVHIGKIGHVAFASGGIVNQTTYAMMGEAGPEAIVPLNRPLSQVDPSVRALSAAAQGIPYGGGAGGKTLNVAPGAVVIAGVSDPTLAADAAIDRMVVKL